MVKSDHLDVQSNWLCSCVWAYVSLIMVTEIGQVFTNIMCKFILTWKVVYEEFRLTIYSLYACDDALHVIAAPQRKTLKPKMFMEISANYIPRDWYDIVHNNTRISGWTWVLQTLSHRTDAMSLIHDSYPVTLLIRVWHTCYLISDFILWLCFLLSSK